MISRERINNEELAEVLTAAANTAEEHMALANLKSEMVWYAAVFDRALINDVEKKDLAGIIEGFIKTASSLCAYRSIRDGE